MKRFSNPAGKPGIGLILILILGFLVFAAKLQAADVRTGLLRSEVLQRYWKFHVYLPPGFSETTAQKYPLIYLLHGSGGTEKDWDRAFPVLDSLIHRGILAPLIAVAPASGTSWWVDGAENFETAFFEELLPFLEKQYPVIKERQARMVCGFSMGGYGALRYALKRPDLFGGALLLSPALYREDPPLGSSARSSSAFGQPFNVDLWRNRNYPELLPAYLKAKAPVTFFIAAGDDDWNEPEGMQFNMELQALLLYQTLKKQYHQEAELRIVNGGHDWQLWLPLWAEGLQNLSQHCPPFRGKQP